MSVVSTYNTQNFTFRILLIEHPMGMHGVISGGKVLQMDHNNITDLSSQHRSQVAQLVRVGSPASVCCICILSEHRFLIHPANALGSSL